MQIALTFRHMDADEAIRDYVEGKVGRLQKYIENPREVHVVLSVEKFRHIAEITITGDGLLLNSQGKDNDLYAAVDQMVEKMERQFRERREKKRKRPNTPSPKTLPQSEEFTAEGKEETGVPPMIKRRRTLAKLMSLDEAVGQMKLSQKDFLVFVNSDSNQLNVLHRGKDGGIEWVEPAPK